MRRDRCTAAIWVVGVATLVFCWFSISTSPIKSDGLNNLQLAHTLAAHGVIGTSPDKPSMSREPLPVLVTAAWMRLSVPSIASSSTSSMEEGPAARTVKYVNLLWVAVLLSFTVLSAVSLTGSRLFGLVALLCIAGTFVYSPWQVDGLNTDLAAAALLMASSYFAIRTVRSRQWPAAVGLGVALGLLTLTKAIAIYAAAALLPCLVLIMALEKSSVRQLALLSLTAIACLSATVAPWLWRNSAVFDTPSIALRGGRVLYYRSLLNTMPPETYRAAFYFWTPTDVKPLFEAVTGYSRSDWDDGGKGVAAPLNRGRSSFRLADKAAEEAGQPANTIALLSRMKALNNRLAADFRAEGYPNPAGKAQAVLQEKAVASIKARPFAHLATVAPIYWSMMWLNTLPLWLGPFVCASLFAAFCVGLYARNTALLAFTLLPVGMFTLYLLVSHGLPRYSEPIIPTMIVAAAFLIYCAIKRRSLKLSMRPPPPNHRPSP